LTVNFLWLKAWHNIAEGPYRSKIEERGVTITNQLLYSKENSNKCNEILRDCLIVERSYRKEFCHYHCLALQCVMHAK